MSGKPIIVTGGAGFIGSHACKSLAEAGYLPVTIDNLSTGHADAVKWGPLEKIDIRNTDAIADVLHHYRPVVVMHFAALAYVAESMNAPDLYYDNNVGGMISLLTAMKTEQLNKLVFSSSCATYGVPDLVPIRETTLQKPINPYGHTKLIGEMMVRDHAAAFGLRYVILRYFNAAGADSAGELRERHDPETHLIPLALMASAGTLDRLKIFGTDYDTPDGTCIRDYIHVSDLVEAHRLALVHLEKAGKNLVLNLGSGDGVSIIDIIQAITRMTGRPVPHTNAPRRPGDPAKLVAATDEAKRILGFSARHSDIETILRDAAPHFGLEVRHRSNA